MNLLRGDKTIRRKREYFTEASGGTVPACDRTEMRGLGFIPRGCEGIGAAVLDTARGCAISETIDKIVPCGAADPDVSLSFVLRVYLAVRFVNQQSPAKGGPP